MKHDLMMGRVESHSNGIKLDSVVNRGFIIRILEDLIKDFKWVHVTISLIHSLIRASVEDLGCLGYLLLDKNARPNRNSYCCFKYF